jgi:hypothetical protein
MIGIGMPISQARTPFIGFSVPVFLGGTSMPPSGFLGAPRPQETSREPTAGGSAGHPFYCRDFSVASAASGQLRGIRSE